MRTALITGASRGLGFAFVEQLANQGYQVFATYRSLPADCPLAMFSHPHVYTCQMDVGKDNSIARAYKEIAAQSGHLDVLINNAAINHDSPKLHKPSTTQLGSLERSELLAMFDINTIAPTLIVQRFLSLLNDSTVINISSYRASFTRRDNDNNYNNYGYAASKVALNMMTRDLAHDLQSRRVRVYAIDPGSVHTAMNKRGEQTPDQAANKILTTLHTLTPEQSGQYFDNQGRKAEL